MSSDVVIKNSPSNDLLNYSVPLDVLIYLCKSILITLVRRDVVTSDHNYERLGLVNCLVLSLGSLTNFKYSCNPYYFHSKVKLLLLI